MSIIEQISAIGIVPVIKLNNPQRDALPLAKALCDGGVPVAEITFRAEGAAEAIQAVAAAYPEMIVGAGTVLSVEQVKKAADAGAKFVVSPGFNPKTVEYCQSVNMPILPGCITPTEIEWALSYGLEVLKFFPAEQSGGLARIKAMSAPFSMVRFMPTGGISLDNLGTYSAFKSIVACGGSYMVTDKLIEGGHWDDISALCKKSVEIVKEARING